MKRLILTNSSGLDLMHSGLAEVVIPFVFRFVWGPLPSPDELAAYVAARSRHTVRGHTGRTLSVAVLRTPKLASISRWSSSAKLTRLSNYGLI